MQGYGNVGSWAAVYLQHAGVKVIGVCEFDCNLYKEEGIDTVVSHSIDYHMALLGTQLIIFC